MATARRCRSSYPGADELGLCLKPGGDEKGQMFGIDRGKFERIVDTTGKSLPADKAYHVYNAFVDFHTFCNVFAERAAGRGIQDLKKIGDKNRSFRCL
jgi:hypothetical protein